MSDFLNLAANLPQKLKAILEERNEYACVLLVDKRDSFQSLAILEFALGSKAFMAAGFKTGPLFFVKETDRESISEEGAIGIALLRIPMEIQLVDDHSIVLEGGSLLFTGDRPAIMDIVPSVLLFSVNCEWMRDGQ